jgi:peptide/nickel transport system permease protein
MRSGQKISAYLKNHPNLYFTVHNKKVVLGLSMFLFFALLALLGTLLTPYYYSDIAGGSALPPNAKHILGTTQLGEDVFSQVIYGLRATFITGLIAGGLATLIGISVGFLAGYYGGSLLDEGLMMITNIMLVIPIIAVLVIISAYLRHLSVFTQALIIGSYNWPWVARAVRAQTLAIKNNPYVNLSHISSIPISRIIREDIAFNMFSYIFMAFILQFSGSVLAAATLDFIGVGPTQGISLGLIMRFAILAGAILHGYWWWMIIPGLILTLLIVSLYLINTGLDEVFNPRLREL